MICRIDGDVSAGRINDRLELIEGETVSIGIANGADFLLLVRSYDKFGDVTYTWFLGPAKSLGKW